MACAVRRCGVLAGAEGATDGTVSAAAGHNQWQHLALGARCLSCGLAPRSPWPPNRPFFSPPRRQNGTSAGATGAMSGAKHRQKGDRVEREIVELLKAAGIHSERYPYSGATRFRGKAHDLDVYLFGRDDLPATFEVKARKGGRGFKMLGMLESTDGLFMVENYKKPKVSISWDLLLEIAARLKELEELKKKEKGNAKLALVRPGSSHN